jgi:hypothetical protein
MKLKKKKMYCEKLVSGVVLFFTQRERSLEVHPNEKRSS